MRRKHLIIWPLAALPLVSGLEALPAQTAPVAPTTNAPGTPAANGANPTDLNTPSVATPTVPTTNPAAPAGGIGAVTPLPLPEPPVLVTSLADARNLAGEQTTPLLLEDALVLALENSPLRVAALAGEAAARARIGTSRSAGGLQINLTGNASLSHNQLSGFGGSGSTVGTTNTGGSASNGVPETFPSTGTVGTTGNSGAGQAAVSRSALRDTGTTGTGTTGTGTTGGGTTPGGATGGNNGGNVGNFFGSNNGFFNNNESLNLGLTYPLYTGGRVKASVRQAQYAALAQAAQTLQTESDILLATTSTYLGVLRAGQLLDVTESNLAVARERRRIAGVRYAAGASARLDVLTADTTLADAIQRRLAAGDSLAQYKATLNSFIGREPETPLRVEPISTLIPRIPLMIGTSSPASAGATAPGAGTVPATGLGFATGTIGGGSGAVNDAVNSTRATTANPPTGATAVGGATRVDALGQMSSADLRALTDKSRASLATAEQQVNISQAGVDLAKAQRRPSLGLSLAGLINNPVTAIISRFGAVFGLNIAQNLFDSGRSKSQIAEAQALLAQSQQSLRNQRLNLYNQIEQALLQFDAAQKSVASTDTAVVAGQEAVRAAQLGYQAGVRTSVDVSDAQNSLLQAQTNAVNSRFDAAIAQVSLAAAVGVSTEAGQTAYLRALREEAQRTLATQVVDKKHRRR